MQNIINRKKYDYKSIAVSSKNYEYLQNLGKTGMTFNEVLDNVLPLVKSAKTQKTETTS
ncbi:MAG: hypothetical protein M3P08_11235 [Thermoproteota archaeon]|nr:hypothetical protein [Thermoproteota archaeon]